MDQNSILVQRHSARAFEDKAIPVDVIKDIVREAALAPSWENSQPWKAYVATGETVKRIRASHFDLASKGTKSWTEVVPPQSWSAYTQGNIDQWLAATKQSLGDATPELFEANKNLFNAPAIVYITIPKDASHYSAYDAGAFGYGLLLAAQEHGLRGIPAYEFIRHPAEVRAQIDIPEDESLMMGVALGFAKDNRLNSLRTERNDLDTILRIAD
ncbi:nitroreductase [Lacticaseibacillus pantheris]|jgi:nitroreductase